MLLNFFPAKNGSLNCSYNNKFFHSNYNPENEAEKFVNALNYNFIPEIIFISEPALSYSASYLRKKFPFTKLIAIRFSNAFIEYDNVWDSVINFKENTIENDLDNFITEENFSSCIFLSWKNSENIFIKEAEVFWNLLKNYLQIKHDILNTKNYFSSRWLKNTFNNSLSINKISSICKGNQKILIAASGFSLKNCLKKIQDNRKSFFLICLSSALNVLLYNRIIPDLCITSDGGFWAKKHLEYTDNEILNNIPFAYPVEAALPYQILKNNISIPLDYKDSFSSLILQKLKIPAAKAVRNGTVSGSAIDFALSITDNIIGIIGLDLCNQKTYSHTQPNALEKINSTKDFRLKPLSTRLYKSEINTSSLNIYANWFNKQINYYGKVFRIYENEKANVNISTMVTIDFDSFISMKSTDSKNENLILINKNQKQNENKKILLKEELNTIKGKIENIKDFSELIKDNYLNTFLDSSNPGELMLYKKYKSDEYLTRLKEKSTKLIKDYLLKLS